MKERSVYSINQRRRLEAETRHEREERLQQLSDNQQRKCIHFVLKTTCNCNNYINVTTEVTSKIQYRKYTSIYSYIRNYFGK